MTQYIHDMLHCNQSVCKKKGQCYRYWLGQEIRNTDNRYASFYNPEEPVKDGCQYYVDKQYFE